MDLLSDVVVIFDGIWNECCYNIFYLVLILKGKVAKVPIWNYKLKVVPHSDLELDFRSGWEGIAHDGDKHVQHMDDQEKRSDCEKDSKENKLAGMFSHIKTWCINLTQDKLPNIPDGQHPCGISNIALFAFAEVIKVLLVLPKEVEAHGKSNNANQKDNHKVPNVGHNLHHNVQERRGMIIEFQEAEQLVRHKKHY